MGDDSNMASATTTNEAQRNSSEMNGTSNGELATSAMPTAVLSAQDMDHDDEQEDVMNEDSSAGNTSLPSTKPHVDVHGRPLNPRSCVTCRKRKVRCDKVHPCTNCTRAHIECVFPSPGRAPRKVRKMGESRDKELLDRLRRLEGVVKGLGVEVPDREGSEITEHHTGVGDGSATQAVLESSLEHPTDDAESTRKESAARRPSYDMHKERTQWIDDEQKGRFENRFGRLVIDEGRSRYINNSFWASLSNEVEDLKGILNQSSDEDDDESSHSTSAVAPNHQGWAFGYSSLSVDMLSLHPRPAQIELYWETYVDRVDPLCKVLHIPTLHPTVLRAASHLPNLSKGFECLVFAVYYAATTSLSSEDCIKRFGEEKQKLLTRYRFAVEQALARANFLTTEEIVVLQAFVIFLICLRRNNDARVIWTLTGLVVRIAQTIGIHRDGSHFALPPFEVEMRRRLWWQVCILDTRASEDHGCDPTIIEQSFDTKMPLNINDVDMHPEMEVYPAERQGCTDITFCLIRFEVSNTFRRINYIPPGPQTSTPFAATVSLQDKERWITNCHHKLEERYLQHCDMSVPLFWVTATVARLMMSKMWLMVYHPFQRHDGGASLSEETKEKLFITSLENVEYSLLLETEVRTMKWGWLFKTYMQWHALAFMLSELCNRTTGDLVERAWVAVEKTRDGRWGPATTEYGTKVRHLWRPLKKLYRKAKEARSRGLHIEQLAKQAAVHPGGRSLTESRYSPNVNSMFDSPNRPTIVRAPLSNAQLQRFSQGPTFGQMPLDKHELMRSPKLSETIGDIEYHTQPSPQSLDRAQRQAGFLQAQITPTASSTQNDLSLKQHALDRSQNLLAQPSETMGFALLPQHLTATSSAIFHDDFKSHNTFPEYNLDHVPMNSLDPTNLDLETAGIMDTSGDLNWENWDQLVRQFGMDLDPAVDINGNSNESVWPGEQKSDFATGASGYTGPAGQNLRLGMGMGGGDWF